MKSSLLLYTIEGFPSRCIGIISETSAPAYLGTLVLFQLLATLIKFESSFINTNH